MKFLLIRGGKVNRADRSKENYFIGSPPVVIMGFRKKFRKIVVNSIIQYPKI